MAFVAAGLLWFSQISADGTYLGDVLVPSLLAAVGLGLSFVPLTIAAMSGVGDSEAGLASGLINTSQQVGGALGLAVLSSVAFPQIETTWRRRGRPRGRRRPHRGLRRRVHGRRRHRAARRDRDAGPDPQQRLAGPTSSSATARRARDPGTGAEANGAGAADTSERELTRGPA